MLCRACCPSLWLAWSKGLVLDMVLKISVLIRSGDEDNSNLLPAPVAGLLLAAVAGRLVAAVAGLEEGGGAGTEAWVIGVRLFQIPLCG